VTLHGFLDLADVREMCFRHDSDVRCVHGCTCG
jgi:hypothetical protein